MCYFILFIIIVYVYNCSPYSFIETLVLVPLLLLCLYFRLVYVLMGALFIVSYPLSKILDCCLGKDHGTFYRRSQLKALIDIHGEGSRMEGAGTREDTLTKDEVTIIKVNKKGWFTSIINS